MISQALRPKRRREATLVVFHTAVLGYVGTQAQRDAFARSSATSMPCGFPMKRPVYFPTSRRNCRCECRAENSFWPSTDEPVAFSDPHGER